MISGMVRSVGAGAEGHESIGGMRDSVDYSGKTPDGLSDVDAARKLDKALDRCNGMRALARNCLWASAICFQLSTILRCAFSHLTVHLLISSHRCALLSPCLNPLTYA